MSRFSSQETICRRHGELVEAILDGLNGQPDPIIMFILAPDLAMVVVLGALLYGPCDGHPIDRFGLPP